jgi:hypothetical protein
LASFQLQNDVVLNADNHANNLIINNQSTTGKVHFGAADVSRMTIWPNGHVSLNTTNYWTGGAPVRDGGFDLAEGVTAI